MQIDLTYLYVGLAVAFGPLSISIIGNKISESMILIVKINDVADSVSSMDAMLVQSCIKHYIYSIYYIEGHVSKMLCCSILRKGVIVPTNRSY